MRSLRGTNAQAVIKRLNPIIRGWAAYYRTQVSSEIVRLAGSLHVAAHLQVGQLQPPEQAEALGRSPGTSASSTSPGTTGGCSATARAAPTCTSSPGQHRPTPDGQGRGVTRRPRPDRILGPATAQEPPCRSARPACGSTEAQDGRCPICRGRSSPPKTRHKPRTNGNTGWPPPAKRSHVAQGPARRTKLNPVSYTSTATTATARHFCTAHKPSGLA